MSILITGASGQLGAYLLRELAADGADVVAWSGRATGDRFGVPLRPVDLTDEGALRRAFAEAKPSVVIHGAAVATIAECQRDPARAAAVNATASERLAEMAASAGARLVLASTDLVFDGSKSGWREDDLPNPLSEYGRTKAAAEQAVLARPRTAVARLSLLFGPTLIERAGFFDQQLQGLRTGQPIVCFRDEWRTPLSLRAATRGLIELARSDYEGPLHLGGPERLSRLEMGLRLAAFLGADAELVVSASRLQAPAAETRPQDTCLCCARWRALFPGLPWLNFEESLTEMLPSGTGRQ